MVAAPVVEGTLTGERMAFAKERAAFLESDEGKAAKRMLFAFRIWCVVELHSALEFGVPIIIRAGTAARDGDKVTYNTGMNANLMLVNLSMMIDVEKAECAVQADYDREIKNVREGVGADTVNKRVAGVVAGGAMSAQADILEVDAAVCGEPEALRELPDNRVKKALEAAAAGGRLAAVEVLLARGVVDLSSEWVPLYTASGGGHVEVVKALLGAGAAVDLAHNDGRTPLYMASYYGHVAVVRALLGAGAAVDLANNNGRTPLFASSYEGHLEVVRALLGAGSAVDLANNDGFTPLSVASEHGHVEVVKALREHGASVTKCACIPPVALSCCLCCLPFCFMAELRNVCSMIPTLACARTAPASARIAPLIAPQQAAMDRASAPDVTPPP